MCSKVQFSNTQCMQSLKFLKIQIPILTQKKEVVESLVNHKRPKRGIFNGGSYMLNWLIGTPDVDDLHNINDAISQVEADDKSIQNLMKEQIQVVKSTITNFNESIHSLKIHESTLNENIKKLNHFIDNEIKSISEIKISLKLNAHMNELTYLANELNEQYDLIINAILFSKTNITHPSIITPRRFVDELNNKMKLLENGKTFPLPLDYDHAYKLLDISELKSFYYNERLIFVIEIPLSNPQIYNLYKIIPLPITTTTNTFSFINPSSPYLAMATNKMTYLQLDNLDDCKPITEDDNICKTQTVYSTMERPSCETNLLTSTGKDLPLNCRTSSMTGSMFIWHPLKFNEWIYAISKEERLTIICKDNEIYDKTISNIGILSLSDTCRAYCKNTQLVANFKSSSEYTNIIPEFDIRKDECCIEDKSNSSKEKLTLFPLHFTNIRLDELNQASHRLTMFEEDLNRMNELPHIRHGNFYLKIIQGICATFGIFLLYKFLRYIQVFHLLSKLFCKKTHNDINPNSGCMVSIYNQCFDRRLARDEPSTNSNRNEVNPYISMPHLVRPTDVPRTIRPNPRRPISSCSVPDGFSTED